MISKDGLAVPLKHQRLQKRRLFFVLLVVGVLGLAGYQMTSSTFVLSRQRPSTTAFATLNDDLSSSLWTPLDESAPAEAISDGSIVLYGEEKGMLIGNPYVPNGYDHSWLAFS